MDRRNLMCTFLGTATLLAVTVASPYSRDKRFLDSVYDNIDRANACLSDGQYGEATAYTEMVMLTKTVKIYIDLSEVEFYRQDEAKRAALDAMAEWEETSAGGLNFESVERNMADVTLRFTDHVQLLGKDVAGRAEWRRKVLKFAGNDFVYQVTANIQVRMKNTNGKLMSPECLKATAMHELGHVIGFDDSPRVGDVMGPLRTDRPALKPTENEQTSLFQFRTLAFGIMQQAMVLSAFSAN